MEFNPFDPKFRDDPFPKYAALRREAPVFHHETMGFYAVSRYDDVVQRPQESATSSRRRPST